MSSNQKKTDMQLTEDELKLIRLFRCMNQSERDELLVEAGCNLMKRFSVDADLHTYDNSNQAYREEMNEFSMRDRLRLSFPTNIADFFCWDELGDAGVFIDRLFDRPEDWVFGIKKDDEKLDYLIEEFILFVREYNPYMSLDYVDNPTEETMQLMRNDFAQTLAAWRESVISTIERQASELKDKDHM